MMMMVAIIMLIMMYLDLIGSIALIIGLGCLLVPVLIRRWRRTWPVIVYYYYYY